MVYEVAHLEKESKFIVKQGEETALVEYEIMGNNMEIFHTYVPSDMAARGVGSALIKSALEFADRFRFKVSPTCPFAKAYMNKHQEYNHLL